MCCLQRGELDCLDGVNFLRCKLLGNTHLAEGAFAYLLLEVVELANVLVNNGVGILVQCLSLSRSEHGNILPLHLLKHVDFISVQNVDTFWFLALEGWRDALVLLILYNLHSVHNLEQSWGSLVGRLL